MTVRRPLTEGLKPLPPTVDSRREHEFVYGPNGKAKTEESPQAPSPTSVISRTPISTKIRTDYAEALKRASLERQLSKTEPNTLQDILEQAIGPWLKSNGYLP